MNLDNFAWAWGRHHSPTPRRRRRAALRSDLRRAHPHSGPRVSRLRGARGARGGREAPPAPLLPFFEGSSHERQAARPDPRGARLQDGRAGARDHRQGVRSAGEDPHTPAPARAETLTTNTLWADSLEVARPWVGIGALSGEGLGALAEPGAVLGFLRLCEMHLALRLVGHALIPGSEPYSMRQAARGAEIRFRGEARA